jgi:hypothetical protein
MNLEESYRALNLKPGAKLEEARRSYYELVKFFHPDRHQSSPGLLRKATEETKKLNLAYERVPKFLRPHGDRRPKGGRMKNRRRRKVPATRPFTGRRSPLPPAE